MRTMESRAGRCHDAYDRVAEDRFSTTRRDVIDGLLTPVFWDTTGESRMSAADEGHNRSYVHGLGGIDLQQRPAASNGLGHLVVP